MKLLFTHHMKEDKRRNRVNGKIRIFLNIIGEERPIEDENIIGDFAWRREQKTPLTKQEAERLKIDALHFLEYNVKQIVSSEIPMGNVTISYSRYAGCTMCPCSPGYVLTIQNNITVNENLWVTIQR